MNHSEVVSENILHFMKQKNYTRLDLAEEASISKDTLGAIINGNSDTKLGTIVKISDALDIPWYYLLLPHAKYLVGFEEKNISLSELDDFINTTEHLRDLYDKFFR